MYAVPGESTDYIVGLYQQACANAAQTIVQLDLDVVGTLPRSGEKFTLRQAMVHVIQESSRHAGHADVVRELIDGSIGEPGTIRGFLTTLGYKTTSIACKRRPLPLNSSSSRPVPGQQSACGDDV